MKLLWDLFLPASVQCVLNAKKRKTVTDFQTQRYQCIAVSVVVLVLPNCFCKISHQVCVLHGTKCHLSLQFFC